LSKKCIGVGDDDNDDVVDDDEDATVDDEAGYDALSSNIHASARIVSSPKFLLHISLRGGVLVFSAAVLECWISGGESICRGGAPCGAYGRTVQVGSPRTDAR
jgi:hypothetical protein